MADSLRIDPRAPRPGFRLSRLEKAGIVAGGLAGLALIAVPVGVVAWLVWEEATCEAQVEEHHRLLEQHVVSRLPPDARSTASFSSDCSSGDGPYIEWTAGPPPGYGLEPFLEAGWRVADSPDPDTGAGPTVEGSTRRHEFVIYTGCAPGEFWAYAELR